MAVTVESEPRLAHAPPQRSLHLGRRRVPIVLPNLRDPRIHLAITTFTIITIGMAWIDFRLSLPQIAAALFACGTLDVVRSFRSTGMLVWPASALQTGTSTALILRITGFGANDWWSFDGWYYFAGIATAGLLTKYYVRYRGSHVFNPSNVALVAAFLVFGAERIEPLDFWWGPFDWAVAAAYAVILIGGITLCRRLRLLEMCAAFYATFAAGVGVLALLGQSITTQWSLAPVSGAHYWWVLVTSPETLIFLFFMITDPRTIPTGRAGRIAFGTAVAAASTVLLAPWETEFGTKVGLLSGLVVVTAARPFVGAWTTRAASTGALVPRARRVPPALIAAAGGVGFLGLVAVAGAPNRSAATGPPPPAAISFDIDPDSLPPVSIDDDVAGLSAELASPSGARDLAAALAFNLQVEAEALRTGDASLLTAVDHGDRLAAVSAAIESAGGGEVAVPSYRFDTLHLSIVYPGGAQSGANAGLAATGTLSTTTYSPDGEPVATTEQPFDIVFSLRELSSGRWLTTDTPTASGGGEG